MVPDRIARRLGQRVYADAELVLLAMGFTGPVKSGLIEKAGIQLDQRGNIATENYQSSIQGVFAAGDVRRGQSLVRLGYRGGSQGRGSR